MKFVFGMFGAAVACASFAWAVVPCDVAPEGVFKDGSVVLFIGDSITHGGRRGDMNHYLGHGYQAEIAARYLGYRPEKELCFLNRGISGDTTEKLLKRWDKDVFNLKFEENGWRSPFPKRTGTQKPDIVSLLVGINDFYHAKSGKDLTLEKYAVNLEMLVSSTLKKFPGVEMVLCEPFSLYEPDVGKLVPWRKAAREVAERHNLCFVDFQTLFSETLIKENPRPGYWFWDRAHPTYAAHIRMADYWIAKVSEYRLVGAAKERVTSLDGEWLFSKNGGAFEKVEVPHDWGIAGPFKVDGDGNTGKLPWKARGVYRRMFTCRRPPEGGAARLEFDGVMARPEVFVNGVRVGGWDYGYVGFTCDISSAVRDGENELEVRADTRGHGSRWYPGGGIFRSVRLVECAKGYTLPGSVFITTPEVSGKSATVKVEWETLDGKHEKTFTVENPVLWSPETPKLYTVDVNGTKYRYGIRTCEWTANDGFHLNGKRVQIKGANLHYDFGPLGLAFHKGAARRQLEIMRDMGVNAIRTAHNPPASEFLDLCDEMGFLVWDECFDKWNNTASRRKDENLEEYVSRNLSAFVRRDRNHPCVICWSISNEIRAASDSYPDGQTKERVAAFAKVVRAVDPTRPVGSGNCKPMGFPDKSIFEALDVTGWNYARAYAAQHDFNPRTQAVVMTESACNCSSRDWYGAMPPANKLDFDFAANEVSAYDSCAAQFGDIPDVEFHRIEHDRYCAGEFVWSGFDYLGEPYPFEPGMNKVPAREQSRSSYFGCVDLTGVPKNEYYLYRSQWNDKAHAVHIVASSSPASHAAYVYTDGDAAELFADGRSLGMKRKLKDIDYPLDFKRDWPRKDTCEGNPYYAVCDKYRLRWFDVPTVKGELMAVAYKDGMEIGREVFRMPGKPARLEIEEEKERDGLLFFHVKMVDDKGTLVTDASNRVAFSLSGSGHIIAVGNGNANGYDSFADVASHPLYRGRALAIVRRTGKGEISLNAEMKTP